jgi:outer membrane protein assembly factor BamB
MATTVGVNPAAVLTQHNDNSRTGANLDETVLHTGNVNVARFGRIGSMAVDGHVYAQPLYVPLVNIPGHGAADILYVGTMNNTVYAFDADTLAPLWTTALGDAVPITNNPDIGGPNYRDIQVQAGIISTPVVSTTLQALYVVTFSRKNGEYLHHLHALDLATGKEKFAGPRQLMVSVAGTGAGSIDGAVTFESRLQNQRPALLLVNGRVYIAFASYGDSGNYHGWVLGYDAATLEPLPRACNLSSNAIAGGVWQAGQGPAADANGNVYVVSGNGNYNTRSLAGKSILVETAIGSPALANIDDTSIALAWTGNEALRRLNVAFSTDAKQFTGKITLTDTSLENPALCHGNGRLFLAWTAPDPEQHVNVMSSGDLQHFANKVVLNETSPFGPALAFGNGRVFLAWVGREAQQRLNVMSSADGVVWENKVTLTDDGAEAPALHFANGRLYLTWVGTDANRRLNIMESTDGMTFTKKVTLAHTSASVPSLAVLGGFNVAWTGVAGARPLMIASGVSTDTLGTVETYSDQPWQDTAADGTALVTFKGRLYIAWAGNEFLRRLNIAEVSNVPSLGDCFVKLSPDLDILDWFTPWNTHVLNALDNDLGSGGLLLVPDTNVMTGGGKEGKLFVIDRDHLGRFCSTCNDATGETHIVDVFQATAARNDPNAPEPANEAAGFHHIHGSPVYWQSPTRGPVIYLWGEADWLRAYAFGGHTFAHNPVDISARDVHTPNRSMPGAMMSLSADGSAVGTGILWAVHPTKDDANQGVVAGTVSAFDADNLKNRLWHSDQAAGGRDALGMIAKFTPPTVVNGRVYMATFSHEIVVYGLRS